MKTQHILFVGMVAVVGMIAYYAFNTAQTDDEYIKELQSFRKEKNQRFLVSEDSPLDKAQREGFDSLQYFPPNLGYRVTAELEWLNNSPVFSLPTSQDGKTQDFRRVAVARFAINGEKQEVVLLESAERPDEPYLYLFFQDQTSGKSTYSAGRYVEVEKRRKKTGIIDFNRAYNPYCAYNDYYICPMPPRENRLSVPIEAGEKNYEPIDVKP